MKHPTAKELEAGLAQILNSPMNCGTLDLIVRRPRIDERETLESAELDIIVGLVGDNWKTRGSHMTADSSAHPGMQLTMMNSRVINLVAQTRDRWPLAGDQLYVDLNLNAENLPPKTRLSLGTAAIEISEAPHLGCAKFAARFGKEAIIFVNSRRGKQLNLRGINVIVVQSGVIHVGNELKKI